MLKYQGALAGRNTDNTLPTNFDGHVRLDLILHSLEEQWPELVRAEDTASYKLQTTNYKTCMTLVESRGK